MVSQLHADAVLLLMGLTVALCSGLVAVRRPRGPPGRRKRSSPSELAQGPVGFVQYFTDLPVVLVGFHLLGAALITACLTWVLLRVRHPHRRAALAGSPATGDTGGDDQLPYAAICPVAPSAPDPVPTIETYALDELVSHDFLRHGPGRPRRG